MMRSKNWVSIPLLLVVGLTLCTPGVVQPLDDVRDRVRNLLSVYQDESKALAEQQAALSAIVELREKAFSTLVTEICANRRYAAELLWLSVKANPAAKLSEGDFNQLTTSLRLLSAPNLTSAAAVCEAMLQRGMSSSTLSDELSLVVGSSSDKCAVAIAAGVLARIDVKRRESMCLLLAKMACSNSQQADYSNSTAATVLRELGTRAQSAAPMLAEGMRRSEKRVALVGLLLVIEPANASHDESLIQLLKENRPGDRLDILLSIDITSVSSKASGILYRKRISEWSHDSNEQVAEAASRTLLLLQKAK